MTDGSFTLEYTVTDDGDAKGERGGTGDVVDRHAGTQDADEEVSGEAERSCPEK